MRLYSSKKTAQSVLDATFLYNIWKTSNRTETKMLQAARKYVQTLGKMYVKKHNCNKKKKAVALRVQMTSVLDCDDITKTGTSMKAKVCCCA